MQVRRASIAAVAISALVAGTAMIARAQGTPSVDVKPVNTTPTDPNSGQWFVESFRPGEQKTMQARIINPAQVPQTIRLYLADLEFTDDGTPHVADRSDDVGAWKGGFAEPNLTIPAQSAMQVPFTISAPDDVEPGDHVGAVVAEGQPEGTGNFPVVKRVATRLYITVPGEARREFVIEQVTLRKDAAFFPREMTVETHVRNTGRVRLQPVVNVNGDKAEGSKILLSHSLEPYIVTMPIPFWGGPLRYRIDVLTEAGITRQMRVSSFVVPWHLIALGFLGAGLVLIGRLALRKRGGKYQALKSDIHRIERLLAGAHGPSEPEEDVGDGDAAEVAIRSAITQARRAGDAYAEARLREKLDESRSLKASQKQKWGEESTTPATPVSRESRPAARAPSGEEPSDRTRVTPPRRPAVEPDADELAAILRDLTEASGSVRERLLRSARAYGPEALDEQRELIDTLPATTRVRLLVGGPK